MENIKKIYKLSHSITKIDKSILKDIIKIGGSDGNIEDFKKDIMDYITYINKNLSHMKELEEHIPDIPKMSLILEYHNFTPFLLYKLLELLLLKLTKTDNSSTYTLPQNICNFKVDDKFDLQCFERMYKAYILDCKIPSTKTISYTNSDMDIAYYNLLEGDTYLLFCPETMLEKLILIVDNFKTYKDSTTTKKMQLKPPLKISHTSHYLLLLDGYYEFFSRPQPSKKKLNFDNNKKNLEDILAEFKKLYEAKSTPQLPKKDGNYYKIPMGFKTNLISYLNSAKLDSSGQEQVQTDYLLQIRNLYGYLYLFFYISNQLKKENEKKSKDSTMDLLNAIAAGHNLKKTTELTEVTLIEVTLKDIKSIQKLLDTYLSEKSALVKSALVNIIVNPSGDYFDNKAGQFLRNLLLIKFFTMLHELDTFCSKCILTDSTDSNKIKFNESFINSESFTKDYEYFKSKFAKAYGYLDSVGFDKKKIFGTQFTDTDTLIPKKFSYNTLKLMDDIIFGDILLLFIKLCKLKAIYRYDGNNPLIEQQKKNLNEDLNKLKDKKDGNNYKKACNFLINVNIETEIKDPVNKLIEQFLQYCNSEITNIQSGGSDHEILKTDTRYWGCIFVIHNNKTKPDKLYEVLPLNNYMPIPQITELTLEKLNNAIKLFLSIPNDDKLQEFLESKLTKILIDSFTNIQTEKERIIREVGAQIDENIEFAVYTINTLLNMLYKEYNKEDTNEDIKKKICLYIEMISSYVAYKFKLIIIDFDGKLIIDKDNNELIKDINYEKILNIFAILEYFKDKLH